MDHLNIAAAAPSTSFLSLLYEHSQTAFGQLFSLLNKDWIKGRPCIHGCSAQTKSGPVRGKTFKLGPDGRRVNAFLGIPYARAGTNLNRFKKPFPVECWQEPLDCTQFGPRAIQYDMFWDTYLTPTPQDEARCLHISVFAPDWESVEFKESGRPVIVFVHGGGFLIHSAANYGDWNICQNLCLHDVVVCVVQYRLGLLGFLSTGDQRCPGNFGLWDQLAAFQWVKENIGTFGGNPENVTAFGQSAGAASIDLLSISPLTKGLFKRVILMGGNASTDWAVVSPEKTQAAACRLAKRMGWKGAPTDLDSLLAFLCQMPSNKLTAPLIGKSAFNRHRKGLEFCPVVDGELIPRPVDQLRRQMDWPLEVIVGGTEFEALLFVALGRPQSDLMSLQKLLRIYIPSESVEGIQARKRFEEFYLDGVDRSNSLQISVAFLRLHSDLMMNNSVQRYCQGMLASEENQRNHRIYLYNMSHFNADEFGFVGLRMPFYAATHCHDLRYLLGKGLYSKFRPNWDDKNMVRIMGTLFTNFVKYGNPNAHSLYGNANNKINANGNCQTAKGNCQNANVPNGNYQSANVPNGNYQNANVPNGNYQSANGNCQSANANGSVKLSSIAADGTHSATEFPTSTSHNDQANLWLPITPEDTYRHLELCLEPTMRPDYQGRRYELWRQEFEKMDANNNNSNNT